MSLFSAEPLTFLSGFQSLYFSVLNCQTGPLLSIPPQLTEMGHLGPVPHSLQHWGCKMLGM